MNKIRNFLVFPRHTMTRYKEKISAHKTRKAPLSLFLLISAILNFLLFQFFFVAVSPNPKDLKSAEEKKFYVELLEMPITEETEPPEKTERLAEKSHKAKKESTRDEITKLSKSVPQGMTNRKRVQRKPSPPSKPIQTQKRKEVKKKISPEKGEKKVVAVEKPKPELHKKNQRETPQNTIARKQPESSQSRGSQMTNPNLMDVPYDYKTDQQLLGTPTVNNKEVTVDLNTTEYKYISYFTKLKEKIYQVWKYPKESKARREQGDLRIVFIIKKDGSLEDVRIIESSGFRELDREVLRTIKVASPYNPFPKSWEEEKLRIPATFDYKLPTWVRYYN